MQRELSYVIVELEKFHKKEGQLQSFEDEWLFFLKDAHSSSSLPVLKDRLVTQAFEAMEKANWTSEEYDAYVRALLLLETEELRAESDRAEGKAEGLIRGLIYLCEALEVEISTERQETFSKMSIDELISLCEQVKTQRRF